jgi:hypothetical protein
MSDRGVMLGLDGEPQPDGLDDRQQCLERRVLLDKSILQKGKN